MGYWLLQNGFILNSHGRTAGRMGGFTARAILYKQQWRANGEDLVLVLLTWRLKRFMIVESVPLQNCLMAALAHHQPNLARANLSAEVFCVERFDLVNVHDYAAAGVLVVEREEGARRSVDLGK